MNFVLQSIVYLSVVGIWAACNDGDSCEDGKCCLSPTGKDYACQPFAKEGERCFYNHTTLPSIVFCPCDEGLVCKESEEGNKKRCKWP